MLVYGVLVNRHPWLGGDSQRAGRLGVISEASMGRGCSAHPNPRGEGAVGVTCCELLPGFLPIAKVCAVDPLALGQLANRGCVS